MPTLTHLPVLLQNRHFYIQLPAFGFRRELYIGIFIKGLFVLL